MLDLAKLLLGTVVLRPYVFIFLAVYLVLAVSQIGVRRTLLFTLLAYSIAFLAEWSSAVAATGFPFGLYYYIDTTSARELWIAGVPFMDSLSFAFLSYVSWRVAILYRGLGRTGRDGIQQHSNEKEKGKEKEHEGRGLRTTLLASFFMTCLDVVIDPVALRGDRWFLGRIYYYPEGGVYFGVTIENFLGWFLVCFVILQLYLLCERAIGNRNEGWRIRLSLRHQAIGVLGLYFGILLFNLFITFWIGELLIGLASAAITALLAALLSNARHLLTR